MYINNDIDYMKYLQNKKIVLFGAGKQGKKAYHNLVYFPSYLYATIKHLFSSKAFPPKSQIILNISGLISL